MRDGYKSGGSPSAPPRGALSRGYPTEGDQAAQIDPTTIGAWWFHAVTEEIMAVIREAGMIPSDSLTQLRDAINIRARRHSPDLTGTPTAPTPPADDNDSSIATTHYVTRAIAAQATRRIYEGSVTGTSVTSFNVARLSGWALLYYADTDQPPGDVKEAMGSGILTVAHLIEAGLTTGGRAFVGVGSIGVRLATNMTLGSYIIRGSTEDTVYMRMKRNPEPVDTYNVFVYEMH